VCTRRDAASSRHPATRSATWCVLKLPSRATVCWVQWQRHGACARGRFVWVVGWRKVQCSACDD
jgi:hypothetical protein